MKKRYPKRQSASRRESPRQQFWFVREPDNASEEVRIYSMTGTQAHADIELLRPNTRLFVEGQDDRGPAVKIILTYGVREGVWYPQTEGQYFITYTGERPAELKMYQLHFGDVSSPQPTKAAAHRILLDILEKTPELKPYLKCVKRPCVFCKDHPDVPGGSTVDVPLETLPPPCGKDQVAQFYMGANP